jgi:hypothetical protein
MEQQQNMIEVIKPDAIIQIKLNRDFYTRLVSVLNALMEPRSVDELNEAAKQIDAKSVSEPWIYNYETMLYLVKACEDYCRAHSLTEMRTIDDLREESQKQEEQYKASIADKSDPQ